jgi:hypothetical protein
MDVPPLRERIGDFPVLLSQFDEKKAVNPNKSRPWGYRLANSCGSLPTDGTSPVRFQSTDFIQLRDCGRWGKCVNHDRLSTTSQYLPFDRD